MTLAVAAPKLISRPRGLVIAARPATLLASLGPVLVGTAIGMKSAGTVTISGVATFFATALAAALMQAGANLVNDVKDFERGVDDDQRVGPPRMTQSGLVSATDVRYAYRWVFAAALVIGVLLALKAGPLIFVLGAASVTVAYMYTAGPFPLSYHGLGEVAALVFFGPVAVAGSAYLQFSTWDWRACEWGFGPGLIAASMMAINNYRDRATDSKAGKRTLALLVGEELARRLPFMALVAAWSLLAAYGIDSGAAAMGAIFGLGGIALVRGTVRPLLIDDARSLNVALKRTAKFHPAFAVAFAVLTVIGRMN